MSGIDDVKRSLSEWCSIAAERTSEVARVTSRRYDRFAIGREIERRFAELGALVHAGLAQGRTDVLADPRVATLRAEVEDLERERRQKEQEIDDIRRQSAMRRDSGDGAVEGTGDGSGDGTGDGARPARGPGGDDPEPGDRHPDFSD